MHFPRLSRPSAAGRFPFTFGILLLVVAPAALAATLGFPALRCTGIVGVRVAASR
jgi:ABC-type branched-subunit amino acid transport system permease subunit